MEMWEELLARESKAIGEFQAEYLPRWVADARARIFGLGLQDAEEIGLEFMHDLVMKKLPAFDPTKGDIDGWLKTCFANHVTTAGKLRKRERQRFASEQDPDLLESRDPNPTEATVSKEERARLESELVGALNRDVVILALWSHAHHKWDLHHLGGVAAAALDARCQQEFGVALTSIMDDIDSREGTHGRVCSLLSATGLKNGALNTACGRGRVRLYGREAAP